MTGGHFLLLKIITFIFLTIQVSEASKTHKLTKKSILFNFKTSKIDKRLSREINSYIRHLNLFHYKKNNVKNILRLLKKSSAFSEFKKTFKWSTTIVKLTPKSTLFYKLCKRIPSKSSFEEKIIDLTLNYCNRRFLKTISSSRRNSFNEKQLLHLQENIETLISKKNNHDLSLFLSRIKSSPTYFNKVSTIINNYYINNYISPPKNILKVLNINDVLTQFIQENGVNIDSSKIYFSQEFQKIIKEVRKSIKKEDPEASKLKFSQAISFYQENKRYISNKYAWKKLTSIAKNYTRKNKHLLAHDCYQKILHTAGADQKDEAYFNLLMNSLQSKQPHMIKKTLNNFSYLESFSKHSLKLQFWVARALTKTGDQETALYLYKKISNGKTLNYYSILASREISRNITSHSLDKIIPKNLLASSHPQHLKKSSLSISFQRRLKRLNLWINLQMDGLIELESDDILAMRPNHIFKENIKKEHREYFNQSNLQKFIFQELITLYNERGKFLQTFKLVYKAVNSKTYNINDDNLKVLFPFRYIKKIQKYSKAIDPILILSLIRQESAFNPNAKSSAGARGLMQLMPATAKQYKKRLKAHQLTNPSLNLRIGIKYLKKLLKKYDGNLIHTLAAYNAGEGRVKRWMKGAFLEQDPLLSIEAIPFKETRNYVKYIYRNIFFYKFLSNDLNLSKSLKETFMVSI